MITIPVKVIKPFKETRTPCPPAGTVGELYRDDGDFMAVRFPLPMVDTEGATWLSQGDDTEYMSLLFRIDEIEEVEGES